MNEVPASSYPGEHLGPQRDPKTPAVFCRKRSAILPLAAAGASAPGTHCPFLLQPAAPPAVGRTIPEEADVRSQCGFTHSTLLLLQRAEEAKCVKSKICKGAGGAREKASAGCAPSCKMRAVVWRR